MANDFREVVLFCTHVTPDERGGVATSARTWASSFECSGAHVMWLVCPMESEGKFQLRDRKDDSRYIFENLHMVAEFLAPFGPNIIISHFPTFSIDVSMELKKKFLGSKLMVNFRGNDVMGYVFGECFKEVKKLQSADLLTFVSGHLRDLFLARNPNFERKSIIVENGTQMRSAARFDNQRLGCVHPGRKLKFGALGFWKWKKGLSVILDALELRPELSEQFAVAGPVDPREPNLRKRLEKFCNTYPLEYIGTVNDNERLKFLRSIDVIVVPSLAEGIPNVLFEAVALGCYPIGSNIPGISEVILKQGFGKLFSPASPQSLLDRVDLVTSDRSLLECYYRQHSSIFNHLKVDPCEVLRRHENSHILFIQ